MLLLQIHDALLHFIGGGLRRVDICACSRRSSWSISRSSARLRSWSLSWSRGRPSTNASKRIASSQSLCEDHVAVDGRDYTIHDVGAASERSQSQNQWIHRRGSLRIKMPVQY